MYAEIIDKVNLQCDNFKQNLKSVGDQISKKILDPVILQIEKSTGTTIKNLKNRDSERTQLMIALYLGIGITICLVIVSVIVEYVSKQYYNEMEEDELSNSSIKSENNRGQVIRGDSKNYKKKRDLS